MRPLIFQIPLPFELFGHDALPIRAFGLMVVLALLTGNAVATRLARKNSMNEEFMGNLFVVFTIAAIVGARAFYVITNLGLFADEPLAVFYLHRGGMVYYGSFLLTFLCVSLYCRRHRVSVLQVLDIYAVAAAIGMSIGRVGCLLVGDDYGKSCGESFPLAIKFSTRTEPGSFLGLTIPADNDNLCALQGQWLHPAQLYMSLNALTLFFILRWMWHRRRFDGQVVSCFIMLYAVTRSIIEFFRGDEDRGYVGALSTSQFVSIFVFTAGLSVFLLTRRAAVRSGNLRG